MYAYVCVHVYVKLLYTQKIFIHHTKEISLYSYVFSFQFFFPLSILMGQVSLSLFACFFFNIQKYLSI